MPEHSHPRKGYRLPTSRIEFAKWLCVKYDAFRDQADDPIGDSGILHMSLGKSSPNTEQTTKKVAFGRPSQAYLCKKHFFQLLEKFCPELVLKINREHPPKSMTHVGDLRLAMRVCMDEIRGLTKKGNRAHDTPRGRRPDKATAKERQLVFERWKQFKENYTKYDYSKASMELFAQWATDEFDDMPTDDHKQLSQMVDTHRRWLKANGHPKKSFDQICESYSFGKSAEE